MDQYLNYGVFTISHPRMVMWCSSTMLTLYFLAISKNKRQYFEPKNSKEGAKRKRNDLVPFVLHLQPKIVSWKSSGQRE